MLNAERARILFLSGISKADLAVYFDFDSEEEFLKELDSTSNISHHAYLQRNAKDVLVVGAELSTVKAEIELKRNSPERLNHLVLAKIVEYAKTLGNPKLITKSLGMTPEALDEIIVASGKGKSFKEFAEQCRADGILQVGRELFNKAVKDKDSKTLQFLAEKVIEEMKEVPKVAGNTFINNGQVQYLAPPPVIKKNYIEAIPDADVVESIEEPVETIPASPPEITDDDPPF